MSQMSWGIGWRMNLPPVCARIAGRPKVPVHENDLVVVSSLIWMASASASAQLHISKGASMPRGQMVLS
jgi:hypothetical protein